MLKNNTKTCEKIWPQGDPQKNPKSIQFAAEFHYGDPWGPRAHFGDQLWISLVASSVLEALWGSFWMPLGLLRSSFRTFGTLWDQIF